VDNELGKWIKETGIRRIARESGLDRETVALILRGKPVKQNTLAKLRRCHKA